MTEARRWWLLVVLAGLLMPTRAAHAQQGAVVGIVEDSSGAPLFAVTITVPGTQFSVATDAAGRFRFSSLPAKAWTLDVRRLGYAPLTTDIDVRSGDTLSLSIMLLPSAVPIAPVVVKETDITPKLIAVGFERRRKLETTVPARQFLTREQIEKQNPISVSQLINRITTVEKAKLCGNPVIYVDGSLRAPPPGDLPPPPPVSARNGMPVYRPAATPGLIPSGMGRGLPVDDIPPSQLEGLEVYFGPQQIPLEFKPSGRFGQCVVLIWTR